MHDDVAMILNDDSDANRTLDEIPFDTIIGDGAENEKVVEQVVGCAQNEPTTPLKEQLEVHAL